MPATGSPQPTELLAGTGAVLFDLDGTLHDDPTAFETYLRALGAGLPDRGRDLRDEVAAVLGGTHPGAAPGRFAEPERGLVVHAPRWVAEEATDWAGRPVALPDDLRGPVRRDGALRYLGDLWQIIGALAAHRGVPQPVLRRAFEAARHHLNDPGTELARLDCLDALLDRVAPGRRLMLATNTAEPLARPLVARLAVDHRFDLVRFDARKPTGCLELIETARLRWGVTAPQVLVVGDNLWNDLLPPGELGATTVHIDPLGTDPTGRWSSARFPDLAAFAASLEDPPRAA